MKIILPKPAKWINETFIPYMYNDTPIQIFYGGSSSGKSVFLAQRTVIDMLAGGRNYLILRKVQRDCKKSVWNEVIKTISKLGLYEYIQTNKTDMTITFPNGYQIFFGGLDDRERIKGITPQKGVITDIWLEEATEFDEDDIKQLDKRLRGQADVIKRIIFSFNPIIQTHWLYKKYFVDWEDDKSLYQDDKLLILKTTYEDNNFLATDDIARLLAEDDQYYIDVYVKGYWGVLGDVIFTNWEVKDIDYLEGKLDKSCHGLDFGFSNDPAAVGKQYYDKKILYVFDEIYETDLTDEQLAKKTIKMIKNDLVTCDSAEPKSIQQLKDNGVKAIGAKKGPGSIETSYRWLQGIKIILHPRCVNLKRELQLHKWKEDRYGNALSKPEDKNNHMIDEIRYGTEEYWQGSKKKAGVWGR